MTPEFRVTMSKLYCHKKEMFFITGCQFPTGREGPGGRGCVNLHIVGENNVGTPKIRKNPGIIKMYIFPILLVIKLSLF